MRTILVPTDFSHCSADAIKYAIHFAKKTKKKLLFFHSAFILIPTRTSTEVSRNTVKKYKEAKMKALTGFIEKIYRSQKIKRNENNTRFLVKFGPSVVENINETINSQFIDLIIIGTHGATGFRKIFTGSNTAKVIEQSHCPVLAIPYKYKFSGIKKIAYACSDLSNLKKELKKIIPIAQQVEASIKIFHIMADIKFLKEKYGKFDPAIIEKSLAAHFKFPDMSLQLIDSGKNVLIDVIGDFVKSHKPDILVMLTQKRNLFEKLINSSQTKELSYQLNVPLLALKQNSK